jgi:hypothetical protein
MVLLLASKALSLVEADGLKGCRKKVLCTAWWLWWCSVQSYF